MNLSLELRLRLLRDFAALCGAGALIYGAAHLAAAAGSDWGFVETSTTRAQVLSGLVMLGAGAICTWVRFLASRELRRRDKLRRELLARELAARAQQLLIESLGRRPANPEAPKPV